MEEVRDKKGGGGGGEEEEKEEVEREGPRGEKQKKNANRHKVFNCHNMLL